MVGWHLQVLDDTARMRPVTVNASFGANGLTYKLTVVLEIDLVRFESHVVWWSVGSVW